MSKIYQQNQQFAANAILNELTNQKTDTILFTAPPQAGKTGAMIHSLELYSDWCLKNQGKRLQIISVNPSDKQLKLQTTERFQESTVALDLVGGDIYHMPDLIQNRSPKLRKLLKQINPSKDLVVCVWDEAHIGIQKKKNSLSGLQVLPEFFDQVLDCLPGVRGQKHIKTIICTATPFSHNHFNKKLNKVGLSTIKEVYTQPGNGYQSFEDMQKTGRIKQVGGPYRKNEQNLWEQDHTALFTNIKTNNASKYYIFRSTLGYQIEWIKSMADKFNIRYRLYHSRNKNIAELESDLEDIPQEPTICIIQQSYKQGKSLELKNVGLWYENVTKSGRNNADWLQSVGRCCGYNNHTFPIYMSMKCAQDAIEYYDRCSKNQFLQKNEMPLSDASTKFSKPKNKTIRKAHWYKDSKAGVADMIAKGVNQKDITFSKMSANNSFDVAEEIVTKKTSRQSIAGGRQNLRHVDAPNINFTNSIYWQQLVQQGRQGQWCWVEDVGVTEEVKLKKDNSYLDDSTAIANCQSNLFSMLG